MSAIYLLDGKPHRLCDCDPMSNVCSKTKSGTRTLQTCGFSQCLIPASDVVLAVSETITLTERERATIQNLIELAGALYYAMDDSEEMADGSVHVPEDHGNLLALGLACLDELPDDRPGFVMASPAKAAWALRRLGNWSKP